MQGESTQARLQGSAVVRPGQMWQGIYTPKYHVIAMYGDTVWALVHLTGVSAASQPGEPQNFTRDFFGQDGMRCIYEERR